MVMIRRECQGRGIIGRRGRACAEEQNRPQKDGLDRKKRRITKTHPTIVHNSIFHQHQHPPRLLSTESVIMLITAPYGQFGPIGREGQGRDCRRVLGVELHALLSVVVPDREETVRAARSEGVVAGKSASVGVQIRHAQCSSC